jgi:PPP family 3-phenylpropionic acid transporter
MKLVPNALFYACYFGAAGIIIPHLPPFLKARGLQGTKVAAVSSFQPLVAIVAPLLWGFLADRTRKTAPLLRLACAGENRGHDTDFFVQTSGRRKAGCHATDLSSCRCPGVERKNQYRVPGFPVTIERVRQAPGASVPGMIALCHAAGLAVAFLVRPVGGASPIRPSLRDAARLLGNRTLLLLMGAGLLHWAALSPFHVFLGIHLGDLGAGPRAVSAAIGLAVACEIPAMLFFTRIEKRLSLAGAIALTCALTALRWAATAVTSAPGPLVALQVLHGFTFGVWYSASIGLLAREVPPEVRASGQALFVAVVFGVGNVLGNLVSGALYDAAGGRARFAAAAGWELLPLALALLLFRAERRAALSSAAPPPETPRP